MLVYEVRLVCLIHVCSTIERDHADGQAYTHELENKVSRLEEENERLRRQKVFFFLYSPCLSYCHVIIFSLTRLKH